ncbi:MAG: RagB/SusD family nutrient uptake outer membrane protein, partial [Bacteroidota bacterium]
FEINFSSETNVLGDDEKNLSHEISDKLNDGNFTQYASWLIMAYRKERADPLKEANLVDRPIYDSSGELDSMQMGVLRYYSLRMANSMSSVDDRDQLMYGVSSANYGTHVDAATHARQYPNFVKKFTHWNVDNGGAGENEAVEAQRRSGVNIPVIRLAEIYLLYAEVMLEEGNLSEALRFINRVRERSHLILLGEASFGEFSGFATYANDIDLDPSNGLEAVTITNLMDHLRFVEKPLELSFEGDRTIDLRRWGVWKQRLEYIAQFEYDTWHYKNNAQEKNPIRWNCFIMPNGELPGYDDPNLPNYAFRQAKNTAEEHFINPNMRQSQPHLKDHLLGSQNFNASSHSYLPIPQDEVFSNLNLSLSGN